MLREKSVDQILSLARYFFPACEGDHLHRAIFTTVVEHFFVDVYIRVIRILLKQLLRFLERIFERIGVSPCEISSVILIEVLETMGKTNAEPIVFSLVPAQVALLTLPFHRVRTHPKNWS